MKWFLILAAVLAAGFWASRLLQNKARASDREPRALGSAPSSASGTSSSNSNGIEDLLELVYCDPPFENLSIYTEGATDEAVQSVAAARDWLDKAIASGETRDLLGAWHILRQLGETAPAGEREKILGIVFETTSDGLTAIIAGFADGEARLYTLAGMGVIGPMNKYPSIVRASQECIAKAQAVHDLFAPTDERPHPGEGLARITLLTPGGFRFAEAELETLLDGDHALSPLFVCSITLQRRLIRVYEHIEGTIESALEDRDMELLTQLLQSERDPNGSDSEGVPYLIRAAAWPEAVSALIEAGADVNRQVDNEKYGWSQTSVLAAVAETGYADSTKMLLEAGADPNFADSSGASALIRSVARKHIDSTRALIDKGADLNVKDADGRFPLLEATANNDIDMISLLLRSGANIETKGTENELTALMTAAEQGKPDTLSTLIDFGADIDIRDAGTFTPIMNASNNGLVSNVNLLISAGADFKATDSQGSTALMFAAQHGHTEIVALLLEQGSDINARGTHGFTALGLALQYEDTHKETIRLLRAEGATE